MDIRPFCRQHVVSDSHGLIKVSRKLREICQLQPFQKRLSSTHLVFKDLRLQYQSPLAMTRCYCFLSPPMKENQAIHTLHINRPDHQK